MPLKTAQQVLQLYREKYFDFNVRHFHEKLQDQHGIALSYSWVRLAWQGAGLGARARRRGVHHRSHWWHRRALPADRSGGRLPARRANCRPDATAFPAGADAVAADYAQLVEQESPHTVLAAPRAVVEKKGVFCALYSDRASHFFETPKAGAKIDAQRLTQVGRALQQLGVRMIPAYSPQARGRSERNFGTWQGRLPQELRLRGITTVEAANHFLCQEYIAEFNRRFRVAAVQPGHAFVPLQGQDLEKIFSVQQERVVQRDNTIEIGHRVLPIENSPWRDTLAGCRVIVYQHLDTTLRVGYGPHIVGRFDSRGIPLLEPLERKRRQKAVEKTVAGPHWKTLRVSHFPTATATTRSLP